MKLIWLGYLVCSLGNCIMKLCIEIGFPPFGIGVAFDDRTKRSKTHKTVVRRIQTSCDFATFSAWNRHLNCTPATRSRGSTPRPWGLIGTRLWTLDSGWKMQTTTVVLYD